MLLFFKQTVRRLLSSHLFYSRLFIDTKVFPFRNILASRNIHKEFRAKFNSIGPVKLTGREKVLCDT
jgi:hypothetical protein